MVIDIESFENKKLLSKLNVFDIIEFGNNQIPLSHFMVMSIDIDDSIPAILLQLWKIEGGFEHQVVNIVEADLGINTQVKIITPIKSSLMITEVKSFRQPSELSEKEQYYFELYPDQLFYNNASSLLPYEVEVINNNQKMIVTLPNWSPLQRFPLSKIKSGSILELWQIDSIYVPMKILKL
ncbi:MAG: hypothetical protein OEY49_05730 [Candidatus Heimdallarchaeota archaeon]|nr:hypothetical protein [Candidatus Heimdallarchaeota archaeon]